MRLSLSALTKSYPTRRVLDAIDADFPEVRTLAFIGPSGGGKSTLLRTIAGLIVPDSGSVRLDGAPIDFGSEKALRAHRRSLGIVFQSFNLFPHLTALENLLLPLTRVHGVAPAEARDRAMATLERFRLGAHVNQRPAQLSGGQNQRVAIARAIAVQPRLLLLDEPTSALDPEMTAEVLELIEELKAEGRAFILVTHEMGFARRVADHAAFLADGQIVEHAPPAQLFERPSTDKTRSFLARILKY